MEYLRLSWSDIEAQCKQIASEIRGKKLKFDVIVGLARGGWIPTRLLSDYLDIDELHTVRVKFYRGVGQHLENPLILHPTQFDIQGKRVLLVDDIADTGESLIATLEHLKEKSSDRVFVVTLVKKPHSKFTPDIYAKETSAWVVFPWEVKETINSIKQKGLKELEKANISKDEYDSFMF
jgi:hypoxanthine phosphoribosyltransferase